MKFNRGLFWKVLGIFAVLDLCILATGCANWETQASSIISLLGPAISAALQILVALGVAVAPGVMTAVESWSQQAQTALTTIKGLIAQYQTAEATAQPGILASIQAAINTVAGDLTTILPELHITDPNTQTKVIAVFGAISGMIAAVAALIPVLQGKVADEKEEARLYVAYKSTAKNFRTTFNEAAGYFGKQFEI